MRTYRVFNRIDTIAQEWTVLGMRWRPPSYGSLIAAIGVGVIIARGVNTWLGIAAWLILSAVVVYLNLHINRMDPEGRLKEGTLLATVWRTMRSPIITNAGELTCDPQPVVTNSRKRI